MDTLQKTPSHTIALAIAIVMQENRCHSGAAFRRMRRQAARDGLTVHQLALAIIEAGASHNKTRPPEAA